MRRSIIVACIAIVSGCATSYQPTSFFPGGFTETQLDTNVFRVTFRGNGDTKSERVEDLVLLRSAKLGIKNNFTHFAIVDANAKQTYSTVNIPNSTSGGQTILVTRPSATNTVVYFKSRPNLTGLVYDAKFLCDSLGKKYAVTCGTN